MNIHTEHTPHDWPEDWADPAEDNGCYRHTCLDCSTQFSGHKQRLKVCKVCSQRYETEAKRKVDILVGAGLNPMEWKLVSHSEYEKITDGLVRYVLEAAEERKLRRELAAALKIADATNSNVAYWGHPGRHRDTSEALLEESAELDEALENREKKAE